jgi:DNA replication protein DnaC
MESYQEQQAKRDAEFFKAFIKDKSLSRAEFNKNHPIKIEKTVKGFTNMPRKFGTDAPTPELKKIHALLATYCAKFPNVETPTKNLLLSGATGTGKTFAAQIMTNVLSDRGFWVCYTTAFNMVNAFQKYVQSFGRDDLALNEFLDCDVLIIDDLGAEPVIKNVSGEHIYNIINERLLHGRAFIVTTNLDPAAIMDKYDQRVASRILAGTGIEFKGKDLRIKKF